MTIIDCKQDRGGDLIMDDQGQQQNPQPQQPTDGGQAPVQQPEPTQQPEAPAEQPAQPEQPVGGGDMGGGQAPQA